MEIETLWKDLIYHEKFRNGVKNMVSEVPSGINWKTFFDNLNDPQFFKEYVDDFDEDEIEEDLVAEHGTPPQVETPRFVPREIEEDINVEDA